MTIPDLATIELGLVAGVALGLIYAMVALSFNLVLGASGVFNLAQGALISGAVIMSYLLTQRFGGSPLAVLATVAIITVLGAIVGSISELLAVRRFLRDARSLSHETMVSTLGLGLVFTAIASLLFGSNIYPVASYVESTPVVLAGIPIRPLYFVMAAVAILATLIVEVVLRYTQLGVVTRAVISDTEGAGLVGISVGWVVQGSFIAAGALAALAGFLIAPIVSASVFVGETVQLYGFAAVAIGGFASFRGSLVGGLIIGLVVGLCPVFIESVWSRPLVYVLVVMMLLVRPAGLFGRAGLFGALSSRQV